MGLKGDSKGRAGRLNNSFTNASMSSLVTNWRTCANHRLGTESISEEQRVIIQYLISVPEWSRSPATRICGFVGIDWTTSEMRMKAFSKRSSFLCLVDFRKLLLLCGAIYMGERQVTKE